jgi:uncharacterized protein (DUF2225 family)
MYLRLAHRVFEKESGKYWMIRSAGELTDYKVQKWEDIYPYVYDDLVQSLTFVDWAREFERLERRKEQNQ